RRDAEARELDGMAWHPHERTEHVRGDVVPRAHDRREQGRIARHIQFAGRDLDAAVRDRGTAVVEWMRERQVGLDPFESVHVERQLVERGGERTEGVDGGTYVVHET